MPCPQSPEPDGFHRYQIAPQGTDVRAGYTTHCVHCGEPKWVHPPKAPNAWQTGQARGTANGVAAKRAQREAKD